MTTFTITLPPEPLALRVVRLEKPPAPVAPRKAATKTPDRRERLLAGMKQIQDPTLRAAFRRRWWRELI